MYRYSMTNDEITIFIDGQHYRVTEDEANFTALQQAIFMKDEEAIRKNLTVAASVASWANGAFTFDEASERFSWNGVQLPLEINARIIAMAKNREDPTTLLRFYEKLQKNVSFRSVTQLYSFLVHQGIPITPDGNILAYKGVNENYTDKYTGKIDNSPGNTHEMPRNQISDDPNHPCHAGFHVGSEQYAKNFGARVVICSVDPADVVCVPYDSSQQKMRVCKYTVVGNYGDVSLPSTTIPVSEIPTPSKSSEAAGAPRNSEHTLETLSDLTIDQLRKIAFHDFHIAGASRIKGGKLALIEMILSILHDKQR